METKTKDIAQTQKDHVKSTIEIYDNHKDLFIAKWDKLFLNKEYEFFKKHLEGKPDILDVGCGHGRDAARFASERYDVIGIDLSDSLLEHAIKLVPDARFLKMDMRNLTFPPNSFGGIWCNSSLHHLPRQDIETTLFGFGRVLKYNGVIFITVKEGEGEATDTIGRFYTYHRENEIKKLLEEIKTMNIKILSIEKVLSNNEYWINAFAMKVW